MSGFPGELKRIMLKLSGEALGGKDGSGLDFPTVRRVSREIVEVVNSGIQAAVVMGAGNLFRGNMGTIDGMNPVIADQIGMTATLMNALALRSFINDEGGRSTVLTAFDSAPIAEKYYPKLGNGYLEYSVVTLLAGGTGNPFFTTDTAAVLRALELNCQIVFKASKVDGVYDSDPVKNPAAKRFDEITYDEVLKRGLGVMDLTAVTLAQQNDMPLMVFNLQDEGAMVKIVAGQTELGTLIHT